MNCPCGTPGFDRPKDLAAHLNVTHLGGHAVPRALRLAWAIAEGKDLAPEDLVVISGDRVPSSRGLSRQAAREDRQVVADAGIPDDAKLNAAIAAATFETSAAVPAPKPKTARAPRAAVTTPVTRAAVDVASAAAQVAKQLGVKPSHPVVQQVLERTGVSAGEETPTMPSGRVPGSQRKCGKCGEKGHRATTCKAPRAPAEAKSRKPARGGKHSKRSERAAPPAPAAVAEGNGHEPTRATIDGAKQLLVTKLTEQRADLEAELRAIDRLLSAVK